MRLLCRSAAVSTVLVLAGGAASAEPDLTARAAGARYGQALGALEICHGTTLTDKAKALGSAYQGAEQDAFKAEAAKVYAAWSAVKNCKNQRDPNQCKIIMDKSCALAGAEIGSDGSVLPGLVAFPR